VSIFWLGIHHFVANRGVKKIGFLASGKRESGKTSKRKSNGTGQVVPILLGPVIYCRFPRVDISEQFSHTTP